MTPTSVRLTLLAARYGAAHFSGDLSAGSSRLVATFPAPHREPIDSAPQRLADTTTPLLLACLPPGGDILSWVVASLPEVPRRLAEAHFRNATAYLASKVASSGLSRDAPIHVAGEGGRFHVTLPDLEAWTGAVAVITAGWTLRTIDRAPWLVFVGADRSDSVSRAARPTTRRTDAV